MLKAIACLFLLFLPAGSLSAQSITLGGQQLTVEPLYRQDFNGVVSRWRFDGRGRVWIQDGRMQMDATGVESTAWFDQEMQGNLLITYDAHILPPVDANNVNLIFMATAPNGGNVLNLFFTGQYSEYQKIPDYIWTITDTHTRLRRDPGFNMVSGNKKDLPEPNKTYHLAVTTWNGLIRCFMDGKMVHSYQDPHPLTRGKLAFRSWHTRLWWDNLNVYQIVKITPESGNR